MDTPLRFLLSSTHTMTFYQGQVAKFYFTSIYLKKMWCFSYELKFHFPSIAKTGTRFVIPFTKEPSFLSNSSESRKSGEFPSSLCTVFGFQKNRQKFRDNKHSKLIMAVMIKILANTTRRSSCLVKINLQSNTSFNIYKKTVSYQSFKCQSTIIAQRGTLLDIIANVGRKFNFIISLTTITSRGTILYTGE